MNACRLCGAPRSARPSGELAPCRCGVSKSTALAWARARWEEAYAHDPHGACESAALALPERRTSNGEAIWSWDLLTYEELRRLSRALFVLCLQARG